MIIDPEGNILNEITFNEGIITADICKEKVLNIRKSFSLKKDRREKLYRIY